MGKWQAKQFSILLLLVVLGFLVAACGAAEPTATPPPTNTPVPPTATATATTTSTPTATPTPTLTSTPTLTPTPFPTAAPAVIQDDLRETQLRDPVPQPGAACGIVDTLDFPIDPPDGDDVEIGGRDFGVYRSRYNGYHTGEDWWRYRRGGRSNFGEPVFAIGHGLVTYAQPLGWGVDKGVVIIQHTFSDGSRLHSFYGHLDPPSVTLTVGECVARGAQIGAIGQPRTSPHLHFEIRRHLPDAPGPGYWRSNPVPAGWRPPSSFIWNYRMANSAGVAWIRASSSGTRQGLGMLDDETYVVIEEGSLVGIDVTDGTILWRHPLTYRSLDATIDRERSLIYLADISGEMVALQAPSQERMAAENAPLERITTLWRIKTNTAGVPRLLPLPPGGVLAFYRGEAVAVSTSGRILWRDARIGTPFSWANAGDYLILTTVGRHEPIWSIDPSGALAWQSLGTGIPVVVGDEIWLYNDTGVHRLDAGTLSQTTLLPLTSGFSRPGDIIALPDGGVLLAHVDGSDRRLVAINADGSLRWQRDVSPLLWGRVRLLALGDQVYLANLEGMTSSANEVTLYWVDAIRGELVSLFHGGSRTAQPETWTLDVIDTDRMVINVGGSHLLVLNVSVAQDAVMP